MRIDDLKRIHGAQPFRPFTIHVGDGRSFRVNHPEFLAQSPSGRTVIVFGRDDAFEVIDLMLVPTIEVPNGQRGSRKRKA